MLIIGGGAKSIGLYAAGLAVAHGAAVVHYVDDDSVRRRIAEAFGAHTFPARARSRRRPTTTLGYDVVVEASSRAAGLRRAIRSLARGGVCTAVGYYLATATRVPLVHMYATDATLRVGVSSTREPCSPTCSPSSHAPASRGTGNDPHGALGRRTHRVRNTNNETRPPARRRLRR